MTKEINLGVILIQSHPYSVIFQAAQQIEKWGWDSIWVADEFEIVFKYWTLLATRHPIASLRLSITVLVQHLFHAAEEIQ